MQKVVFNLKAEPPINQKTLTEAADQLAGALKKPYYDRVDHRASDAVAGSILPLASGGRPGADDREGSAGIQGRSSFPGHPGQTSGHPEQAEFNGRMGYERPFAGRSPGPSPVTLDKFRFLNMFKGMVVKDRHFISADGRNALLVADTPVKVTDSQGSRDLVLYTRGIIERQTPPGINVSFLSGHRLYLRQCGDD